VNETVAIGLFAAVLIVLAVLAFNQIERDFRPTGGWFARFRRSREEKRGRRPYVKPELREIDARDQPGFILLDDLEDTMNAPWGAGQCGWCGKFRKGEDLTETVQEVSYDRLEAWDVPVCRICRPGLYEEMDDADDEGVE